MAAPAIRTGRNVEADSVAATQSAPTRPKAWADLGFEPRRPVRWFSPRVLAVAGLRVVLSAAFGAYLDKRELQAAITAQAPTFRVAATDVRIDYLADTGDGFSPTYTVASLAAGKLDLADGLPPGELLVLGGDQVYPVAGREAYEDRLVGPFRAAMPRSEGDGPELFALPGNHDWYDGLTSFLRLFCQQRRVGGWRTHQARSYFVVQLPHGWWLWGIDTQFGSDLDAPQRDYFERAAELLRPDDQVILCTAEPSWTHLRADPRACRVLAYLESQLIEPVGARLMLTLSGDSHHYAHYENADDGTHKITAGGGGAFLHPTHDLDQTLQVPTDPQGTENVKTYTRATTYPDRGTSRFLALGALALPVRNPSFLALTGILYLLLCWTSQWALRAFELRSGQPIAQAAPELGWVDVAASLASNPISVILVLLILGGLIGFAQPPRRWARNPARLIAKTVLGTLHTGLHLLSLVLIALLSVQIASSFADQAWFTFWLLLVVGILGALAGGVVTGLYLAVSNVLPGVEAHGNEAFSAMRLTGYKNFLRLHITSDGNLDVHAVGVHRTVKRWRLAPEADDGSPWLVGATEQPRPHLIESFTIERTSS